MIARRVIILICVCLCFALLISCAEKNYAPDGETIPALSETSSATEAATLDASQDATKTEDRIVAPEVVFVSGGTEYRCNYYEKSTETRASNGTTAIFCGRATLGGFDRRELVGGIPEVVVEEPFYMKIDGERAGDVLLNLYSAADGENADCGAGLPTLSDISENGELIGEIFVTKSAGDGSSVTYAFYVLFKR